MMVKRKANAPLHGSSSEVLRGLIADKIMLKVETPERAFYLRSIPTVSETSKSEK